ncbi:MAG: ABC transporter permease [Thermoleophilia bacterium]|nr:ABC transporter permease [Thermoleophilia bacterium]
MTGEPKAESQGPGASVETLPGVGVVSTRTAALRRHLSFWNVSALYVFALLFLVFSLWIPELFLTTTTWRTLLNDQAFTAIAAVALVVPLAAGAFNLAIGLELGFAAIFVAWLLGTAGLPIPAAILVTLLVGATIGLISGLLVTRARIDSFIATLGVSSVLAAMVYWVSQGQQILGLGSGFQEIATGKLFGITYPVYYLLAVALCTWYVLEWTPAGRLVYATGGNREAARLAGVPTRIVITGSFVACGLVAAIAGVLVSAHFATGDPTVGPGYLLPAFSAAFLGSTQFRNGRFNVWGTLVAVFVLATGVKGLQLAGAPVWIPDLFNGVALLLAVWLSRLERRRRTGEAARSLLKGIRPRGAAGGRVTNSPDGGSA